MSGAVDDARYAQRLGRFFLALTGLTWALIVLGAVVRAKGAGLACPDWPTCFGSLLPRMDMGVLLEWGHRAFAGTISIVFVAASVMTLRRSATRSRVGRLLALAAALLAVQIVLGGLTVLHLLVQWTVIAHLVTGNLFCLVLLLVARTLLGFAAPARPAPPPVRKFALIAVHLLFLQIVLGGLVSSNYAGLACPDWPTCSEGSWFPALGGLVGIQIAHRLGAYATVLVFLGLAWVAHREAVIGNLARAALSLALFQTLVGVMNVLMRLPVEVTALHSAIATLLLMVTTLLVRASIQKPGY